MIRLGGQIITSADPATSSAAKGESLADTVRVIANYADIMVIRHPRDGAARLAAEYSPIPVINGGDGSHEHPTQTLCDLFTLKQKNKRLKNLKVAISGDLKGSRTIHSFVYALARFGATIMPMPAKGMELPAHVDQRLREEFRCHMVPVPKGEGESGAIDALYVTPEEPHQQSLFSGPEIEADAGRDLGMVDKKVDAVYVTRFQKERWAEKDQAYPRIDRKFLNEPKYSDASVMHPLPRVGELDAAFDSDRRAVYFEQAAYGVPIRMALIALLLGLKGKSLHRFEGGFERDEQYPVYEQPRSLGMHCANPNCIVHDPMEAQYVRNKFHVVQSARGDAAALRLLRARDRALRRRQQEEQVVRGRSHRAAARSATTSRISILFADEADGAGRRLPLPARRGGAAGRRDAPARVQDVAPKTGRHVRRRRLAAARHLGGIRCFGYLCGSIPFGVMLTRLAGTQDIRSVGSGNIGATNVLRTGRKALAAATLLGDMLKGTVAVLIALVFFNRNLALVAGLGAFIGHLFPVWLRLQGRQGRRDLYRHPARRSPGRPRSPSA